MTNKSRSELLSWINAEAGVSYSKIEMLGDGVAYSKLLSSFLQDFPIHKIKLAPTTEIQYIHNFKVIQATLDSAQIPLRIPIKKLVLLKFQDNLEFCQAFFKCFAKPEAKTEQKRQPQKQTEVIETLENERNFYFKRLKHIESILKTADESIQKDELVQKIEDALYQQQD